MTPDQVRGGDVSARPQGAGFYGFVILMLALTGLFVVLGSWQVQRLAEKEALVAIVAARASDAPQPAPPPEEWPTLAEGFMDFRPVSLTGRFRYDDTLLVFTSLANARGRYSGPGYWVMTPLELEQGGLVFVNRGFVTQDMQAQFAKGGAGPQGVVSVSGLARETEAAGAFTPGPDLARRIEWVRDPQRLAAMIETGGEPVAPFTVDLPAAAANALPQGGETVMSFPNNHLGYAITWFGFAFITPLMLIGWVWRQRSTRN